MNPYLLIFSLLSFAFLLSWFLAPQEEICARPRILSMERQDDGAYEARLEDGRVCRSRCGSDWSCGGEPCDPKLNTRLFSVWKMGLIDDEEEG